MSDKSPPYSDPDDPELGEVFLEFYPIGGAMKVSAIHAETGIEVSVMAPANIARADIQRLAVNKLRQRLRRDGAG